MSIHDILRKRLLERAGVLEPVRKLDFNALAATEWSRRFEILMRNRLIIGALRYGVLNGRKPQYDRIAGALKRLRQYQTTGNTECLVDVANMMLLEFEEGAHPLKHFGSLSDDHCCI